MEKGLYLVCHTEGKMNNYKKDVFAKKGKYYKVISTSHDGYDIKDEMNELHHFKMNTLEKWFIVLEIKNDTDLKSVLEKTNDDFRKLELRKKTIEELFEKVEEQKELKIVDFDYGDTLTLEPAHLLGWTESLDKVAKPFYLKLDDGEQTNDISMTIEEAEKLANFITETIKKFK